MPEKKKRVVYLLGTGASHAILKYFDPANDGILMPDIAEEVLIKLENEKDISLKDLYGSIPWSEEGKKYRDVDIESIISLYESSGTAKDKERTNKLRNFFRMAINRRIRKASGARNSPPDMITALVDMYSLPNYNEKLCAILTINYDNFVEKAMINNYGKINIPFEIMPLDDEYVINNKNIPVFCKLHGSFNWENTNPVKINDGLFMVRDDEDKILWVPPGVIKRNDYYPFNAIWGAARFCLKCDILRIIGCSLNTTDWGLISLLHTTNRLRQDNKSKYEIQFIDRPSSLKRARERFPYLGIQSIIEIPEVIEYIKAEHSIEYSTEEEEVEIEKIEKWLNKETVNVFEVWLKAIAYDLINKNISIEETEKGFFQKFYRGLP